MAKKAAEKAREVFMVNSEDHGPADVAAADGDGKKLRFSVEKFVELPEELYRGMSRENQQEYNVTRQLWKDWMKSPKDAAYGELDIIQLHANNAANRMKMVEKPADAHVYYASVEQAYAAQQAGYKFVDVRETAFKPVLPSRTPEVLPAGHKGGEVPPENRHYVFNRETGKPELVAMYIPEEKYQRHIRARAAMSRRKIEAADQDLAEARQEAAKMSGGDAARFKDLGVRVGTKESKEDITFLYGEEGKT